ncbi:MAG: hypothetical protein ABWZ16_03485 [Microbacterium sp.]
MSDDVRWGLIIRVIDDELADGRVNDTTYRLLTTLLDPFEAPLSSWRLRTRRVGRSSPIFDERPRRS